MAELPDAPDPRARIDYLIRELTRHNELYYNKAAPEIGDYEYDLLKRELAELEARHPELRRPDSPTRAVGAAPADGGGKVRHETPMLSIDNTYTAEEVVKFARRIESGWAAKLQSSLDAGDAARAELIERARETPVEYVVELKIDGLSVSLKYDNGELAQAATRGDGKTGEDVTANIRAVAGIPERLRALGEGLFARVPASLEARGEIYLPRAAFLKLRREQEEEGAERVFANPRNAAAGTLKLKNRPETVAARGLAAWIYHPISDELGAETHFAALAALERLGFPVNPHRALCRNAGEILKIRDEWDKLRHELPYDTDGLVIKVNSYIHQEALGLGETAPNWAIAYKFKPEQAETVVRDIRVQVGKLGTLTPVADLEPVFLSGSTITHATLHNATYIKEKDIRIGDRALVEKAGEIIPQIDRVLPEKRTGAEREFAMPEACPACGGAVERTESLHDGKPVHLYYCGNPSCPAQARGRLLHFVSRDAMDIEGFGPAVVDQLLEKGLVADPAGLYLLKQEDLEPLERLAEKSADNLVKSLERSKTRGLARVLAALCIANVGATAARLAAEKFGDVDALQAATEAEIAEIPAGESTAYRTLGAKSARALHAALHGGEKKLPEGIRDRAALAAALESLQLPGFATRKCEAVAAAFSTGEALLAAAPEELALAELGSSSVKRTLGPVVARNLRAWLDSDAGRDLIRRLREAGVNLAATATAAGTGASGKTFVLTGSLPEMGRTEAKKLLEAAGGTVAGSVSQKVHYVVAGADPGSKLDKARALGIPVIDKAEMLRLCGREGQNAKNS